MNKKRAKFKKVETIKTLDNLVYFFHVKCRNKLASSYVLVQRRAINFGF